MKRLLALCCLYFGLTSLTHAQDKKDTNDEHLVPHADDSYKPLKIKLSEDGWQYLRFLTWHQMWVTAADVDGNLHFTPQLRRSRVLMTMQMSPRFLTVTHWGLNNLSASTMDGLGRGRGAQIFMHDAWVEYTAIYKKLYIGAGLHYWNGISRLTSSTTLTTVTLDGPLFNWPNVNRTDQFARHIGMYAKGSLGKLRYRVAVNEPIKKNEAFNDETGVDLPLIEGQAIYKSHQIFGDSKAGVVYQGYFDFNFLDQESDKYPYAVGTYLGKKKVFNIGAGFFLHPDGTASLTSEGDTITHHVSLFAVDAYYDAPLGKGALSSYLVYYNYDFGPNYGSTVTATGDIIYGHVGYLLPAFSKKLRLMPYVSYANKNFEKYTETGTDLGLGMNVLLEGHHAKITLEYLSRKSPATGITTGQLRVQGMVFL
ncbi:MAG: porin [Flammeovirgaceae bacterium]